MTRHHFATTLNRSASIFFLKLVCFTFIKHVTLEIVPFDTYDFVNLGKIVTNSYFKVRFPFLFLVATHFILKTRLQNMTQSKITWNLSFSVHIDQLTNLQYQIHALCYAQCLTYFVYIVYHDQDIYQHPQNRVFIEKYPKSHGKSRKKE